ncbi:hypothetical protein ACFQS7_08570 [Dankookia sp. GCM10030260]|uniref:hypothetical protein n=1 Tax=Dankookia sp. GCM10030260 TaxID=3273390 RepID=UPI003617D176
MSRDEQGIFIAFLLQDPNVAQTTEPLSALAAEGATLALPLRGQIALRLVDISMVMLRVAAIVVLLSPLLGVAILLG